MIFMLLFGAMNTLVMKAMDDSVLDEGPPKRKFTHPFFQGAIMFLGEFTCLFVYFLKMTFCKPAPEQEMTAEGVEEVIPMSPGAQQA